MVHAVPPPPAHQRRRLLGIVCVILGALAGAVAVYALHQPGGRHEARSLVAATSTSSSPNSSAASGQSASGDSSPRSESATAGSVSAAIVVANNTATTTLAGDAAARFEAKGWHVTSLTEFRGDIRSTCAYYDPRQPNAGRAAAALKKQFPGIKRIEPRFDGLPEAPIVVVLTDDWSQ